MSIEFRRIVNETEFHNPMKDFELKKANSEIRYDPLTGQLVRIFPFRKVTLSSHDWTPFVEESLRRFCPFCPDKLETATPRFPEKLIPGGRLKFGEATVVPNLHPYELYSAVVAMSKLHYIPMPDLTPQLIFDSFKASLEFLKLIAAKDPNNSRYSSINWNYMPYAGGSLIHPHLQVLSGPKPTTFVEQMINASMAYHSNNGSSFWTDLINLEQEKAERYLGQTGNIHWLTTYAPLALCDVTGILTECAAPNELKDNDLKDLATGLKKVIDYYHDNNICSFNMALYFAPKQDTGFKASIRIVGRYTLFPLVGSDFSHLQILHKDPWTLHSPEEMTRELKVYFQ